MAKDTINLEDNSMEPEQRDKLFRALRKKKPKVLDNLFSENHEAVFEKMDCLTCANCCKTTSPIFRQIDVNRISKKMKISSREFESTYLKIDEDGDFVLKSAPCPFLGSDNECDIYEYRPQACREYPHTNRKRMVQVLELTKLNMEICPAVQEIVNRIEKQQG